jgi:hypothetical protein
VGNTLRQEGNWALGLAQKIPKQSRIAKGDNRPPAQKKDENNKKVKNVLPVVFRAC